MSSTVLLWGFCAVLLFWGVGAYNRLIRLRAIAITAFVPLQLHYGHYILLVKSNFSTLVNDDTFSSIPGLLGAAKQFEAALKAASTQPLESLVMRALETAHDVLQDAWVRVCGEPQDLAGASLPDTLQKQWESIALQVSHDRIDFNQRIQDYNRGIQQFPANLLAWLFRLKQAYLGGGAC
jgi:LemA protein